jgi:catechol 2,3-dioxygenase-like lactoylglutathione lyase family enzyme
LRLRFLQVGLRVRDLRRSLRFYTRGLGLRERARGDTRARGGGIWVQLEDPRSHRVVELNWYPRASPFGGRYVAGDGIDHLDLSLGPASAGSLEREYRRLLRAGARPTRMTPGSTGGGVAGLWDPDGLWIALYREPTPAERRSMNAASKRRSRRRTSRRS